MERNERVPEKLEARLRDPKNQPREAHADEEDLEAKMKERQ
jgi:hypothetical protein